MACWMLWGWFAMVMGAGAAQAQGAGAPRPVDDLVMERGFLFDVEGTLTVDDMERQSFLPSGVMTFFGNRAHPVWIRLKLKPSAGGEWWLMMRPGYVHLATVYQPDGKGGWVTVQTGSRLAYSQRDPEMLNPTVALDLPQGEALTLYVKLQTAGSVAQLQVLRPKDAVMIDRGVEGMLLFYVSLAVLTLVLAVIGWASSGVRFWLLSGTFDVATLLSVLIYSGLGAKWFLPDAQGLFNVLHPIGLALHTLVALLFFWRLLVLMNAPRWCSWGYQAGCLSALGLAVLALAGKPALALQWLNQWLLMAMTLWGTLVCWFARSDDRLLRYMVRGLWLSATTLLGLFILPWLAPLRPPTVFNLYPGIIINIITMMLSTAIAARFTLLRLRERAQLREQAQLTRAELALQRERYEEAAGFLAMLTHELRNPLGLVRQVSANLARRPELQAQSANLELIDGAVDSVARILDRCNEVNRLESGALKVQASAIDVAELLREWLAEHPQASRIRHTLPEALPAKVDPELLLLMVRNLVENALRYSPADSSVELRLLDDGAGQLKVEVVNMPGTAGAPDPQRVFGKYYREERSRKLPGTGLGLYWVQRVATTMKGSVRLVATQPSVVFELRLPLRHQG